MKMEHLLHADQRKYVGKILESNEKMLGEKPKKPGTPPVAGDHPEIDLSEFCDQDQLKPIPNRHCRVNLALDQGHFWHWSPCHDYV